MRLVGILLAIAVAASAAPGDDKALKPYVGHIIVSPDAPPTIYEELPRFLKMNFQADDAYDVMGGSPWKINFVSVLGKDVKSVTLQLVDKADKKGTPTETLELTPKRRIVLASIDATVAAGFAEHKTYVMQLVAGKTVLAKCEVTLIGYKRPGT